MTKICPYCNFNNKGPFCYDNKDPESAKKQGKFIDSSSALCLLNDGSYAIWHSDEDGYLNHPIRVNYCPMCGRKL